MPRPVRPPPFRTDQARPKNANNREARYSDQFDVTEEDLEALTASARALRDQVDAACKARLLQLAIEAQA